MEKIETVVFRKTVDALRDNKCVISYGGSSSGKTMAALDLLTLLAMVKPNLEVAIIGKSVPVLKRNLIKDWRRVIMAELFNRSQWHDSDRVYTFPNNSKLRFINADDPEKLKGYRCDYFLMDEADGMVEEVFTQLFARCAKKCIITFNPSRRFWVSNLMTQPNYAAIHSTYKDNRYCAPDIAANLESLISVSDNFYKVYCLGEWGSLDGLVYPSFELVDAMPESFDFETVGVDFGWNDKLASVHCRFVGTDLYVNELFYRSKAPINDLAAVIKTVGDDVISYCDEAAPRDIVQLQVLNVNAIPFRKKGGIMNGIKALQFVKIKIVRTSTNLITEIENYSFVSDRMSNEYTDTPVKGNDHLLDAMRYASTDYIVNHMPTFILNKVIC
jgi:phage terminase large subunit